jgi:hypothetical protein
MHDVQAFRCMAPVCRARADFVALSPAGNEAYVVTRIIMSMSRGRGRIIADNGTAVIVARCPLCGAEHRYQKGAEQGEEIEEIRQRGFTDEWLPCQHDLPGNFWRVVITGQGDQAGRSRRRRGRKGG